MSHDDGQSPKPPVEPPWMERSVSGLLRLLGGTVTTFLNLLFRPWRCPQLASETDPAAPPISFLIVGLLFAGISTRAFVLYLTREVDHQVAEVVTEALAEWGPQEILLTTLPIVTLIVLAGVGTARWMFWSGPVFANPIVRGVCYASGFQVVGIGIFTTAITLSKLLRGHDRVANQYLDDGPLLILVAGAIVFGAVHIERVLKRHGQTRLAKYLFVRSGVSLTTSATVFVGVITTGVFSFDLLAMGERGQKEYLKSEFALYGEFGLDARELSSTFSETPDGLLRVEQTFLLENISNERWAIPRPDQLEPFESPTTGRKTLPGPLVVESCSVDWSDNAGWILAPQESRIVKWTVLVPREVYTAHPIAIARFNAAEAGFEDGFRVSTDIVEKPIMVTLNWKSLYATTQLPTPAIEDGGSPIRPVSAEMPATTR